jgi:molybdenum cofactor cytidylyltransferase
MPRLADPTAYVGILLAAGRGRRFDPDGHRNKLLQTLPAGDLIAVASAQHLLAAVPHVHAVVRPDSAPLVRVLEDLGCTVSICADADLGMAHSLVQAIRQTEDAAGWLIALADMPHVAPDTMTALLSALQSGANIAAPTYWGRRGNPVAFSRRHLAALTALSGDQGARAILKANEVLEIAVDDPGILQDIDSAADLAP